MILRGLTRGSIWMYCKKEKRQTAEMISVHMAEQDCINSRGRQAVPIQGRQDRRAAVEQQRTFRAFDQVCRHVPSAGTVSISGSEKSDARRFHERSIALTIMTN